MKKFRLDIQALRGLAVALVVLDHAGFGAFKSGFLGVDIFFVISGYLITEIITTQIRSNDFRLADFYYRRAKRLIPASYATILLTCIGSIWLLDSIEMHNLLKQVKGAISYTTNFVLLKQTGYFDSAAATKPLLHMWSLAVEEQFYLIFPLILLFTPRRHWLSICVGLLVASIAACFYVGTINPSAAFYLLPTRAWELLIGSAGYLSTQKFRIKVPNAALLVAVLILLVLPLQSLTWHHPGGAAILISLATLIVILAKNDVLENITVTRKAAIFGNISYSLYLVHWPIIVFFNSASLEPPTVLAKISVLLLSLLVAACMYKFVEQPSRSFEMTRVKFAFSLVLGAGVLLATQFSVAHSKNPDTDFASIRRPNFGLDIRCDSEKFRNIERCRTSKTADTIVWGDSYAMHSVQGIKNYWKNGIVQATFSACPPFLNTAPYISTQSTAERNANSCISFNDDVYSAIKESSSIKTVILAASFWQYTIQGNTMQARTADGKTLRLSTSLTQVTNDLGNTIEMLQKIGKEVIVIGPPPAVGDSNVSCMERRLSGKYIMGENPPCALAVDAYKQGNSGVIELLANIENQYKVKVIRLSEALCDDKLCHTIVDGTPIYRDSGHLSYVGSAKVFEKLEKANKL